MIEIKPKTNPETDVLYIRGVYLKNKNWLIKECAEKNMRVGEYMNELLEQLRKNNNSQTRTKKRSKKTKKR